MSAGMDVTNIIAALDLPPGCQVDRRIPKTLLTEHGASTAADKRAIADGIALCRWVATIKPETAAVSAYQDADRDYGEIHVLVVSFHPQAKQDRLTTMLHRAVAYPIILLRETVGDDSAHHVSVSLAHQRRSQAAAQAVVLDGEPVVAIIASPRIPGSAELHPASAEPSATRRSQGAPCVNAEDAAQSERCVAFCHALALSRQPRDSLYALYQGWMDTVLAWQAAQVTGTFALAPTPEGATLRRAALVTCARLRVELARLRTAVAKETQMARRVDLNLAVQRAEAALAAARANL